ncbi:MAG: hypothetical protein RL291_1109 [Pseudomonadota bacterium]
MTDETTIDYEALELSARRFIVRSVLERVAKTGLPGGHHFYIAFLTQMPGVSMSKRLKERYPTDMTIVLQHRFWDLIVTEDRFEVKLTFESIPERLVVPFSAIRQFYDPSVPYGMQFDDLMMIEEPRGSARRAGPRRPAREDERGPQPPAVSPGDVVALTPVAPKAPTPIRPGIEEADAEEPTTTRRKAPQRRPRAADAPDKEPPSRKQEAVGTRAESADEAASGAGGETADAAPAQGPASGNVVSLDKFRKK